MPVVTTVAWDPESAEVLSTAQNLPRGGPVAAAGGPRRLGGLPAAAQLPGARSAITGRIRINEEQLQAAGRETVVTSEPMQPERDPSDPTSLPPLFSRPRRARDGSGAASPCAPGTSPRPRSRWTWFGADTRPPPPVRPAAVSDHENIDWGLVAAFRTLVATRLAAAMGEDWRDRADSEPRDGRPRVGSRWTGRAGAGGLAAIEDLLVSTPPMRSPPVPVQAWTPRQRALMAQAIFDAVFRLGRLQPLVDDDRVENIFILGCRQVLLELTDGTRDPGPAVAESDEELIDFLRFLANRSESNPRPFSEGTPRCT
jgi:pilus assembly protein CpaF